MRVKGILVKIAKLHADQEIMNPYKNLSSQFFTYKLIFVYIQFNSNI